MQVRQALLGDAPAITDIHCSRVVDWQRLMPDGTRTSVDYAALSLYERWQHGGPWLSVETCSVWLGHLLQGTEGFPLVVESDGQVVGQAEVFLATEAEYGKHLNISTLSVHQQALDTGVENALLDYIHQMAEVLHCTQVTVAYPHDTAFYEEYSYQQHTGRVMVKIPVHEGRVFYKAKDLPSTDPHQIENWYMALGRFQNAREEWERMHWKIWNGVPELVQSKWHSISVDLTGQPCILHLHQHDDNPEVATARVWTKFEFSTHVLSAVRDRAYRLGYRAIVTVVDEDLRPLLLEAEDQGTVQWLYTKRV